MIVVTGGAGFIGSNLVRGLNNLGYSDILIVDDLSDGTKFRNLVDLKFHDYIDKDAFLVLLQQQHFPKIDVIFHQGACSDTTEWNGRYMLETNYEYSKSLFHYCIEKKIPLIYASSAAVYGGNQSFAETPVNEAPLNIYGYSKLLFDNYVRRWQQEKSLPSQVVGLRYFNVYGPHEQHKGKMASVMFHFYQQLQQSGTIKVFGEYDGYAAGEHRRDFIFVDDVISINVWFWQNAHINGIFNSGTGQSHTFNEVAQYMLKTAPKGKIEYIPFPSHLAGAYQSFTEANTTKLQQAGYKIPFTSLKEGIERYVAVLAR